MQKGKWKIRFLYTPRRNMKAVEAELHSVVTLTLGGLSDQPHSLTTFSLEMELPLLIK